MIPEIVTRFKSTPVAIHLWSKLFRKTDPDSQHASSHASLKLIVNYRKIIDPETDEETRNQFIERVKTAARDQPDHGLSHAAMAWVHFAQKEAVLAIEQATKALEKGPDSFRADWLVERGMYQSSDGNVAAGLTDMTEACRLKPWNNDAHHHRAQVLMAMHDTISVGIESQFINENIKYDEHQTTLFHSFFNTGCYCRPEDLEVTFMVLTEPLNPAIRQFRAERMMDLAAPRPAMLDYQFVSWQSNKNLYANARIEDIRENGILANPPIVDPERPTIKLLPEYAEILRRYKNYYWRKTAWKSGFGLSKLWSWIFIRFGVGPFDESRQYALVNLLLAIATLSLFAFLSNVLIDALAMTYHVKIPQGFTTSVNVPEVRMLINFLISSMILCQLPLTYLACKIFIAIFKKHDSKESEESNKKFVFFILTFPFLYIFILVISNIPVALIKLMIHWINRG